MGSRGINPWEDVVIRCKKKNPRRGKKQKYFLALSRYLLGAAPELALVHPAIDPLGAGGEGGAGVGEGEDTGLAGGRAGDGAAGEGGGGGGGGGAGVGGAH